MRWKQGFRATAMMATCSVLIAILAQGARLASPTFAAADGPSPAPAKVRIALVGDSTVAEGSGWGHCFIERLGPGAEGLNRARGGRSSRSFIDEGHWEKALAEKPDVILIQFGHNDQPGKGPLRETDPKTTYRQFLARYVDEARAIGARPILITSLTRRRFSPEGKIVSDLGPYADAVKAVAGEKKVPVIDLHSRSIELLERLGPEASAEFDPTPRNLGEQPQTKAAGPDRTHLSSKGCAVFGRLVADELKKADPTLASYLVATQP